MKNIKEEYNNFEINYNIISDIIDNNYIQYIQNFFIKFDDNYSYNVFPKSRNLIKIYLLYFFILGLFLFNILFTYSSISIASCNS